MRVAVDGVDQLWDRTGYGTLISTGAGDHFNAGLAFALMHDLDTPTSLIAAVAVSGIYVRTSETPTPAEVAEFCTDFAGSID